MYKRESMPVRNGGSMSQKRLVVVGGNAAGLAAASQARRRNPDLSILVLEQSPFISFSACGFPYFLSGDIPDFNSLFIRSPEFFRRERKIEVLTRHRVVSLDPSAHLVTAHDQEKGEERTFDYERLILATGARALSGDFLKGSLPGIFAIRRAENALALVGFLLARKPSRALVVGGSLLGLEMAEGLRKRGMEVTLAERSTRLLPEFSEPFGEEVKKEMMRRGIQITFSSAVSSFTGEPESSLREAVLEDGRRLPCDLVVLALGVAPDADLAQKAGIALGVGEAVATDRFLRTSASHIYAAGDCAALNNLVSGRETYFPRGTSANRSGRAAGEAAAGGEADFPGVARTMAARFFDLTVARTGLDEKEARDFTSSLKVTDSRSRSRAGYFPGSEPVFTRVLFDGKSGLLLGAEMMGREGIATRINTYAAALSARMTVDDLSRLDLAYSPPLSPLWDPVLQSSGLAALEK